MKPVDQTRFAAGEGNCFTACVASVLELSIDEVPFFMGHDDWGAALIEWCEARGVSVDFSTVFPAPGNWHVIIGGRSPRSTVGHSVVAYNGRIVHDPHPERAGIEGDPWSWILLTPQGRGAPARGDV